MMPDADDSFVRRARWFCISAHVGQTRASGQPFHTHPIAVAELVVAHGMQDADVVAAAYLHDVLEDTRISKDELARRFSQRVANLVEELTIDDAAINAFGDKQKALVAKARSLSDDARWIKLADRLHNLIERMPQLSDEKRFRYATASLALLDALRPWPSPSLAAEIVRLAKPVAAFGPSG